MPRSSRISSTNRRLNGKRKIQPYRTGDDLGREAVALVADGLGSHAAP